MTEPANIDAAHAAFEAWRTRRPRAPGLDWLRPFSHSRPPGAAEDEPPPFMDASRPVLRTARARARARRESQARHALGHVLHLIGQGRDGEAQAWLERLADALDDAADANEAVASVVGAINAERVIRHRPGSA